MFLLDVSLQPAVLLSLFAISFFGRYCTLSYFFCFLFSEQRRVDGRSNFSAHAAERTPGEYNCMTSQYNQRKLTCDDVLSCFCNDLLQLVV